MSVKYWSSGKPPPRERKIIPVLLTLQRRIISRAASYFVVVQCS